MGAALPPHLWGLLGGMPQPPCGQEQTIRVASSLQPQLGSGVLFILPKTCLECLLEDKGSQGLPLWAGGLATGGLVEGLLEGGGPAGFRVAQKRIRPTSS